MNTELFIRRPVTAIVLSLILMLIGLVALPQLGVRETPEIEPPVVTVSTVYFGADPAILETEVTEVLERELNGIDGLRTITSTSRDQSSQITLEFELGHDLDEAANDVRDRVARARNDLPPDVEEPSVEKAEADGSAVLYLRVVGDRSLLELTEIGDQLVRQRMETIDGVSRVDINGERKYAMRVELDAAALAARGLTVADVDQALAAGNVDAPAGRIEGASTDVASRVDAGLITAQDFEGLVVRSVDGAPIFLRDVARVRLGAEDERSSARSDGIPSVTLSVLPQSTANIVDISDEVQRRLVDVIRELPEGVTLELNYDRSLPVRASIRDVLFTLLLSALVVVAVIWAFLRDVRATLIPAAAIVVSLIGTFAFQWLMGFTLNVFTLFGLVLAIGIVVDDAIVVLENVWRHLEQGSTPIEASIVGTREIVVPVVATTLSLITVFLPIIFTGGATGRLFLEFGGTVAASVAISAVVALTLSPALCARLLRPRPPLDEVGPITRAFGRTLDVVITRPWLAFAALALSIAAGGQALWTAPREFFPTEDRNFFMVRLVGPEGVGFPWMDARVRELEPAIMEAVPERTALLSRVNTSRGGLPGSTNSGMYALPLRPREQRDRSQAEIVAGLGPILSQITAFRAIPIQPQTIGGGFGASALQLVIMHNDYDTLVANLPRALEAVAAVPGLTGVDVDLKLNRPETRVVIDRDKAAAAGVPISELARTLQVLSTGIELDRFKRENRQYPVILGLQRDQRDTTAALGLVRVRSSSGALVPIDTLASFQERSAASSRFHYNRAPSATISASLADIPLGTAVERARAAVDEVLPEGFRTALAGSSKSFAESNQALAAIFALSLVLVFLVLAAQFDSFRDPLPILVSLPVGIAGGVGALWVAGEALSFFAQVGLVLLIGLVAKNGILIVEFASQLVEEGEEVWAAARKASLLRLRPIVMTALSTAGGALPIALGLSGSSRSALGLVVVAGVVISTVMALYATPVVWAAFRRVGAPRVRASSLVLLAGALATETARADELTLAAALQEALSGSPVIAASEARSDAAQAAIGTARGDALPGLGTSGRYQYGNSFVAGGAGVGGQPTSFANLQASVTIPLIDPAAWTAVGAAARASDVAEARSRQEALAVLGVVASLWLDLHRAEGATGLWTEALARSQELVAVAADRDSVGTGTRLEVVRAEVQVSTDQLALVQAERDRTRAATALAAALGRPPGALPSTAAGSTLEVPGDMTIDRRPDVIAAAAQVSAAQADRTAATWRLGPRISAFGQGGVLTRFDDNGWLPTVAVGTELTLGGVDGARLGAVHEAQARLAAAQATLEAARRQAEAEVADATVTLEAARRSLELARQALALADEELALAEDRWRVGAASHVEVVQAQIRRSALALGELEAEVEVQRAVVGMWMARGELGG